MTDHHPKADDAKRLRINLYYFIHGHIEQELSLSKLCFELLNIGGVLFGLNVFGPLMAVRYWFALKNKIFLALIYLVCLTGSTLHLYYIFGVIINGELTSSQYYKQSNQTSLPELMFCITAFNITDFYAHQLTGNYLDQVTKELNVKNFFSEIAYLNESNVWIKLKSPNFYEDKNLEMEAFYFANKKCFSLFNQLNYSRHQFFFTDKTEVMRISFNRTMIHRDNRMVYFFTMKPFTMQLYRIITLNFDEASSPSYFIRQGTFKYIINDRFEFFRNPLLLFKKDANLNEVDDYNFNLINRFEKTYNRTTLRLPLERLPLTDDGNKLTRFDLLIDDGLFEEFYRARSEADLNAVSSLNFKRQFILSDLSKKSSDDLDGQQFGSPDLEISLSFFKGVFFFTNSENYIKLILNLLNVLQFWWGLGVLDLYGFNYYLIFPIKLLTRKLTSNLLTYET